MENFYTQKVIDVNKVFDDQYVDAKNLYLHRYNTIPSVNFINGIDGEKSFVQFKERFRDIIQHVHQYRWYKHDKKNYQFDTTILLLKNNCMMQFEDRYCEILHDGKNDDFIKEVTEMVYRFKERQRRQPFEINLIVQERNSLTIRAMEIKRTKLDLNLFYEDEFKETDEIIRKRLNQKADKGIVLLHGLPGTGKTTYLRYLIGKIKKRVLFLSPSIAENIMNPEFIELLILKKTKILAIGISMPLISGALVFNAAQCPKKIFLKFFPKNLATTKK